MASLSGQTIGMYQNAIEHHPKELGIIQRIDGLDSGLSELKAWLENLLARVNGDPTAGECGMDRPSGIPAALSSAEGRLRDCLNLSAKLNDLF